MAYWLIKSEPNKYPYAELERDDKTTWDGVRNFEARNNLRAMKKGDLALYYHSNEGKEVVGVARVAKDPYPDPTAPGQDWTAVDFEPVARIKVPVTLASIRMAPALRNMALLKRSRLSVVPVTAAEYRSVLALGKTKL